MRHTDTAAPKKTTSRKVRAVLIGGVVLGVSAAITLAAWNASEFAEGEFLAGTFALEGSTTSGTASFSAHATAEAAAVVFDVADYGNVSPGDVLYEPYWIRLAANTTSDADLTLVDITPSGLVDNVNEANMSYEIYKLAAIDTACDATGVSGGTLIGSGDDLTEVAAGAVAVALTKGDPVTAAGTAVNLCFVVTAESTLVQGKGAQTVWEFQAVSK